MKSKKKMILGLAVGLSLLSAVPTFAGEWKQDTKGWWYQEDNGSYPISAWKEINGKQYYFGADGYMLANTTTPDGYTVNGDGAWTVNGVVQEKTSNQSATWFGIYDSDNSQLAYKEISITKLVDNQLEVVFRNGTFIKFGEGPSYNLTWNNDEKTVASHTVRANERYGRDVYSVTQGTVKETLELLSDGSIRLTDEHRGEDGSLIRTDSAIFKKVKTIEEINAERERMNYLNGTNDDGTLNEHGKQFDYDHNGYLDSKEQADLWMDNMPEYPNEGTYSGGGGDIHF